ncbi:MAG TPA: choice-of-anchor tandem repeat GloVer-containing protein [Rhizomicrobium sp.]|nr:choice-of-anchor tandem repeat GloVer-containing protein [Rhizomicrobium sp.]
MQRISHVGAYLSMATAMLIALAPATAEAAKERVLYSLKGATDGASPEASLYMDAQGNLYGTNEVGGSDACFNSGCGTVFKLSPDGKETTLHVFTGDDGAYPIAELTADTKGNLYGTTNNGGANIAGTVFKVTPKGKTTIIYNFTGGADGANPYAGLVADDSGNFYGTTTGGGANGFGTVFKITPRGRETVIYSFTGGSDGVEPIGALLRDSAGTLYGTATNGGIDCDGSGFGCGIVFKLTPKGKETVLYRFEGGDHGADPGAGLVMDDTGTLYGTTNNGGDVNCVCGVVYELTPNGKQTPLHVFTGGSDGGNARSRLVADASGNLYGTASSGGSDSCGCGVVFRVTPKGAMKILHAFDGNDGGYPFAGLIADAAGNFYGTTAGGGAESDGTVFKLTP